MSIQALRDNLAHSKKILQGPDILIATRAQVEAVLWEYGRMEAELARWKAAVEGLTPSGSEFVNEPENCAAHIKARCDKTIQFAKERNEARERAKKAEAQIARAGRCVEEMAERGDLALTRAEDAERELAEANTALEEWRAAARRWQASAEGIDADRNKVFERAILGESRIAELEAQIAEANALLANYKHDHASLREQLDRAVDDGIADTDEEKERRLAAESRVAALEAALKPILQAIGQSIGPRTLTRHFQVFGTVAPQLTKAQVEQLQSALAPETKEEK